MGAPCAGEVTLPAIGRQRSQRDQPHLLRQHRELLPYQQRELLLYQQSLLLSRQLLLFLNRARMKHGFWK